MAESVVEDATGDETKVVERPSLEQVVNLFVSNVNDFTELFSSQRAIETPSNEQVIEVFQSWNEVITSFLTINGFFDFVLANRGLPTSGVVDMYAVMESLQGAVAQEAEGSEQVDG